MELFVPKNESFVQEVRYRKFILEGIGVGSSGDCAVHVASDFSIPPRFLLKRVSVQASDEHRRPYEVRAIGVTSDCSHFAFYGRPDRDSPLGLYVSSPDLNAYRLVSGSERMPSSKISDIRIVMSRRFLYFAVDDSCFSVDREAMAAQRSSKNVVGVSPDEKHAVVLGDNQRLELVSLPDWTIKTALKAPARRFVSWTPDSKFLTYFAAGDETSIVAVNLENLGTERVGGLEWGRGSGFEWCSLELLDQLLRSPF
jgi:hypothetical protein